jgi:hypothetical protein
VPTRETTFEALCPACEGRFSARPSWVQHEMRCPHCNQPLRIPRPRQDGQPARALPNWEDHRGFSFACPRCYSVLEAGLNQSGSLGSCPSCGVQFTIPTCDVATGKIGRIELAADTELPTPVHAYAASGGQAPRIIGAGEQARIECPRCRQACPLESLACTGCGAPFTTEAVAKADDPAVQSFGTISFVVGLISLPLCALLLPSAVAVLLGVYAVLRSQMSGRVSRLGLAGVVLGTLSGALGAMLAFG